MTIEKPAIMLATREEQERLRNAIEELGFTLIAYDKLKEDNECIGSMLIASGSIEEIDKFCMSWLRREKTVTVRKLNVN